MFAGRPNTVSFIASSNKSHIKLRILIIFLMGRYDYHESLKLRWQALPWFQQNFEYAFESNSSIYFAHLFEYSPDWVGSVYPPHSPFAFNDIWHYITEYMRAAYLILKGFITSRIKMPRFLAAIYHWFWKLAMAAFIFTAEYTFHGCYDWC